MLQHEITVGVCVYPCMYVCVLTLVYKGGVAARATCNYPSDSHDVNCGFAYKLWNECERTLFLFV